MLIIFYSFLNPRRDDTSETAYLQFSRVFPREYDHADFMYISSLTYVDLSIQKLIQIRRIS